MSTEADEDELTKRIRVKFDFKALDHIPELGLG